MRSRLSSKATSNPVASDARRRNDAVILGGLSASAANPVDLVGFEQRVDLGDIVEAVIELEAKVRREFQIHAMRDLGAQEFLVAVERRDHLASCPCRRAA